MATKDQPTYLDGAGRPWVRVEDTETGHTYSISALAVEPTHKVLDEDPFLNGGVKPAVHNENVGTAKKATTGGELK